MGTMTLDRVAAARAIAGEASVATSVLANATIGQAIDASNLCPGQTALVRITRDGKEYLVTLTLPMSTAQAVAERKSVTGWLTLARGSEDLPEGRATLTIRAEDPTPEGKEAREDKERAKASQERGAEIRAAMRDRGLSRDDAAHYVDRRTWRPGVSQPIPDGWGAPTDEVAPEVKTLTGEKRTAQERHADERADYVSRVRDLIKSGRLQPTATKSAVVLGSDLIKRWDAMHPAPER